MLKRLLCCLFLLACGVSSGFAQNQTPTTQGTEFWLSFMRNGYRSTTSSNYLTLIASAKQACSVTVTNSHTGYSNTFSVPDQGVHTLQIPDAAGYNDQQSGMANKGLLVTSTDTISLYIANETQNSYDAANVLPIQALGCKYMVQTNKSLYYQGGSHAEDNRASFLVVATEDNTQVQVTPTCQTMDGHGNTYRVTLQRGECYHVLNMNPGYSTNADGDLSGTLIESLDNKPIAVFNGNSVTAVADASVNEGYDHVFEQAMPVDNWGKQFVVTRTKASQTLQDDRVKVTALFDDTDVWRNGELVYQGLSAGESRAFWLTETSCYLESSGPVAVYLYNHSHSSSNTYGDPSMVWISPVEQNIQYVIFSTFTSQTQLNHYVNVVCYTEDASDLYLNGNPVSPSEIQTVSGAPQFSYARVPVNPGMNRLSCPGGLVAHVYGMGDRQGYAYTVGSSARILTNQLFVNDDLVTEYTTCQSESLQFRLETNYEPDLVQWNFGDGSPVEYGAETSHIYEASGDYEVEVAVSHVVNGEPQTDRLGVTIHVDSRIERWWADTTCQGSYFFHGRVLPVPFFGDEVFGGGEGSCDTVYHLNIDAGSPGSKLQYDTICSDEGGYLWFDTLRYESGTYLVIVKHGDCDSVYLLHLEVIPTKEQTFEKDTCDRYEWMGRVYQEIGFHTYDTIITGDNGCENHYTLNLTLHASPPFEEIKGLSNVAVATNFWPGQYVYCLDDSTGVDNSRIHWELLDNPEGPGQWEFRPHGTSCTIVAYSMGTRTLHVSSGDGHCDKEAFKTISCSGYGVGENETVSLEVYPNPAKDELMVKGPELLEITIYNLLGQKMSTVPANGDEVKVEVGHLPQALYLLEIRTKRGNKTRLVSVIK